MKKQNNNESESLNPSIKSAAIIRKSCKAPYYPAASIRKGEEGKVQVKILIDTTGVVRKAALLKSSGFKRLDEEAIKYFSRCEYVPASENSILINAWQTFEYTWRIERGRQSAWKE